MIVLIDDRIKAKAPWEEAGGVFVHHTSTAESLRQLRELGLLDAQNRAILPRREEEGAREAHQASARKNQPLDETEWPSLG